MRILNSHDVERCLPMTAAIQASRRAFSALHGNRVKAPLRSHLNVPEQAGISLIMPCFLDDAQTPVITVKVASVFDHNPQHDLARVQAAVLVIDPQTGVPIAMLEGAALTAIRTAAASGLATDLMADPAARNLAILGAGVLARTHLQAICTVRQIETVWIHSPTPEHVQHLIQQLAGQGPIPHDLRPATNPTIAVREADIICCATSAATPVFADRDLKASVHINAVGSYTPDHSEVPLETVQRARVVVDDRQAAWTEAGDLIQVRNAGLIDETHIEAELGELLTESAEPFWQPNTISLFKSVGHAAQDAAAAGQVLQQALQLGTGQIIDW